MSSRHPARRRKTLSARPRLEPLEDRTVPTAGWAVNFAAQRIADVAVDNGGNVYATGTFTGTGDFDPGAGVANLTSVGGEDAFVAKFAGDGSFLWARRLGGSGFDIGWAVEIADGGVYVGGQFVNTADFGSTTLTGASDINGYLARLDADGDFTWAVQFGRTVEDVVVDPSGNVLTTGRHLAGADLDPGTETATLPDGGSFVSKLDSDGGYVWARRLALDAGKAIDADAQGNVYVNTATDFGSDVAVTKLDEGGTTMWGMSRSDVQFTNAPRHGLVVDDRDADPANWALYYDTQSDASALPHGMVVSKLRASDGSNVWDRVFAGTTYGNETGKVPVDARSLALSATGDVYVTGWFRDNATDFDPGTGTAFLSAYGPRKPAGASYDTFLLRLDGNGEYVSARRIGGDYRYNWLGLAVGGDGMMYLGGTFDETGTFDTGDQTVTLDASTGTGFIVKIDPTYGAISGRVIHDANGNGQDDDGFALQGWSVYLDQNGDGQLNPGERKSLTDARGIYTFANLPAGIYTVAMVPQPGWTPTTATSVGVPLGEGRVHNQTFGNATTTAVRTYAASDLPISTVGASSSITLTDPVNILDLNVRVSVTHNKVQELTINLVGPDGHRVNLATSFSTGITGQNLTNTVFDLDTATFIGNGAAPYTGTFRPNEGDRPGVTAQTLSWWDGQLAAGTWTLTIQDSTASATTGTLTAWSLLVTAATQNLVIPADPAFSVSDVQVVEGNSGTTNAVFTVTLTNPPAAPISVDYATADFTAVAGSDYVATSGTLTFTPGGPTTQTITVPVLGDTAEEAAETFRLLLSNPTYGGVIANGQGTATIGNDDTSASIGDATVTEGDTGSLSATFTVTLSSPSVLPVTVNYATANGTALSGSDYTATSGTVTFNPGETSKTISVPVLGNTTAESTETFSINLSGATNATISDGQGVGTIRDNDGANTINFANFGSTTGLTLVGNAAKSGTALRLTPSTKNKVGATWHNTQQAVAAGFKTTFQFKLSGGSDGFAFVIQNSSQTAIGTGGNSLGYGGTANSLAIEFDTAADSGLDPNDHHVSVNTRGTLANSSDDAYSLGLASTAAAFDDNATHNVTIDYVAGTMRVFLDGSATPLLSVPVNLSTTLSLAGGGKAWVGFTGATGASSPQTHDVLSWQFAPLTGGSPLTAAAAGPGGSAAVTRRAVESLRAEAIVRWQAAGVGPAAIALLRSTPIHVGDLGPNTLGLQSPGGIWIDDDAAGWGWFVDPTPHDDREFTRPGDQGERGRMDLLSVLMHEMGHTLGLDHADAGVMHESLEAGTREVAADQVFALGGTLEWLGRLKRRS